MVQSLSPEEAEQLLWCWRFWARDKQLAPSGDWDTWLVLAGRGFGKTRTGAERVNERVEQGARRIYIVGATAADVRDVMVEGESGILAISPPWNRPIYQPSKRRLTWPNGAVGITFSADKPDRLRGPQADTAWADEIAAWRYPDAWDQLSLGLRLGSSYGIRPQAIVTTTPRPIPIIRTLLKDPGTVVTRGSTYENRRNLAASYLRTIERRYEGTRLGRQELYAEVLDDAPGALWKRDRIDELRVRVQPALRTVVVAVDPAVTAHKGRGAGENAQVGREDARASNETGIVVVGVDDRGHGYLLADVSGRYTPNEWAKKTVEVFDEFEADRIIAEVNQGGDLVESNLRTVRRELPIRKVHASRGKRTRAEPVAGLCEQGRIHHVGHFGALEDQLCVWEPDAGDESPDRLDAYVWGFTDLMVDRNPMPARGGSGLAIGTGLDDMGVG